MKSIPQKYKDMVGTEQLIAGTVFSRKKDLKPTKFKIQGIRQGSATIVSIKELREKGESSYEYPTFELLLKNDSMLKAQWSRPFPIREINLKDNETTGNRKSKIRKETTSEM